MDFANEIDVVLKQIGHWQPYTGGRIRFLAYPERYPGATPMDTSGRPKKARKKRRKKKAYMGGYLESDKNDKEVSMKSPRKPPRGANPYYSDRLGQRGTFVTRSTYRQRPWVGAEGSDSKNAISEIVGSGAVAMGNVAFFHDLDRHAVKTGGYSRVDGLTGGDRRMPKTQRKKLKRKQPRKYFSYLRKLAMRGPQPLDERLEEAIAKATQA